MAAIPDDLDELLAAPRCGLLVVDMQNDNASAEGRLARAGLDVTPIVELIPRVASLLALARGASVPVFHSRTVTLPGGVGDSPAWRRTKQQVVVDGDLCLAGSWGAEIHPGCAPLAGETVIDKSRSSAFHGTELASSLRAAGVETIVIAGEQTPGCIEATFRDAPQHDFFAVLVHDCVAAYDPRLHEVTLELQRARGDVCALADVAARWRPTPRTRMPGG
jgi:nicotinamidase-related amidase